MRTLDLRKFHHAIVLAEETSFVRASKRLHLSQPALTRSIQSLERELDLQLFDRQLSGAVPTPQGRAVLDKARQLLEHNAVLNKEISLLKDQDIGQLVFGVIDGLQNPLLDTLIERILQRETLANVEVTVESMARLLDLLNRGLIEFFVGDIGQIKPAERRHLHIETLAVTHGGYFVRTGHPLANRVDFPLQEVAAYPILSTRVDDNEWHQPGKFERDYLKTNGVRVMICNDMATLKDVTLRTDAILVTTDAMVARELAAGTMQELQFKNPGFDTERQLCLVTMPGKTQSSSAKLVLEMIGQIAAERYGNGAFTGDGGTGVEAKKTGAKGK
jgi:DNA-binding transcriptional LysR family regulator